MSNEYISFLMAREIQSATKHGTVWLHHHENLVKIAFESNYKTMQTTHVMSSFVERLPYKLIFGLY